MDIKKEDIPLYLVLVAMGSGGGGLVSNITDNDEALIRQEAIQQNEKEMIQWQKINANELAIKELENQCP